MEDATQERIDAGDGLLTLVSSGGLTAEHLPDGIHPGDGGHLLWPRSSVPRCGPLEAGGEPENEEDLGVRPGGRRSVEVQSSRSRNPTTAPGSISRSSAVQIWPAVFGALVDAAAGRLEGDHAYITIDAVRRIAAGRVGDDWDERFAGMLGYAQRKGWIDETGNTVQAHMEYA